MRYRWAKQNNITKAAERDKIKSEGKNISNYYFTISTSLTVLKIINKIIH